MTLVTFIYVLWSLSGSLMLGILGGAAIPWLHGVGGAALCHPRLVGDLGHRSPLVRVNFDLERYNADFRYRMTRIRENAESIALYEW